VTAKNLILCAVLVVGASFVSFALGYRMGRAAEPERTSSSKPAPAEAPAPKPGKPVDLLGLLAPELTASAGTWTREGDALVGQAAKDTFGSFSLAYAPPDEYELSFEAERLAGGDALHVGLLSAGRPFLAILGGADKEGSKSGLECVDNEGFRTNETTVVRPIFAEGAARRVVCVVRKESVQVSVDGQALIRWKGAPDRLSIGGFFKPPNRRSLFLGVWGSRYRIRAVSLVPISGAGEPLR
jgi:hypothetical protein